MADLKVFSAGVAMRLAKQAVEAFEAEHPELDVEFSGGGSVAGVNRLLGGEDLDVLILADQTAIDEQLMPDFADGYFVWGGNEMCITGKGINSDNWKEVLLDPESEVKHTNPYDDPSGYRAVMAMMLADKVEEGLSDKLLHHPKYKGLDREQYKRNPFGPPPGGPGGKGPGG
ncbi:MAG: substrate-binding domain-containing protein, partial [Clostridia bacterium]|nr:substrate-binding domain-containing protein [Clostridia bacterium]